MRQALRRLLSDDWVIGIAAAIALAYVTVRLLQAIIDVLMSIVHGLPSPEGELSGLSGYPWATEINGHLVSFEALIQSLTLFVVVVPLAAVVLHRIRSDDDRATGEPRH